jgi:DNA-binding transcriptional MerR regulator
MPRAVATRSGGAPRAARQRRHATNAQQYTVDQLSAHTGVPSRTIRFYQTQLILPPPLRSGRIALYTEVHIERLRLVSMLQGRGLQLSAIRDVMRRAIPGAQSLRDWLGLDERLRMPWIDDDAQSMTRAQLVKILADHPHISIDALIDAGLVRPDDGTPQRYVASSPALLHIALQLDAAGIDLDTSAAAATIVRERLAPAAAELVSHFAARVGEGFGRLATPRDLGRAFDVLRPLGVEAVRVIFGQEVQRALRDLVATPPPSRPRSASRRVPAKRTIRRVRDE